MAETTHIEWTDATWNPVTGCSVVSPGCTNCYAMKLAGTRLKHHPSRAGLTTDTKAGPVWNGQVRLNEGWLAEPLRWARPRRIFVCAHGDLFHESVPDDWIDQVFAIMALASEHTFQVLTKRAARMRAYMEAFVAGERHVLGWANDLSGRQWVADDLLPETADGLAIAPLPNVWLGVSAEDQPRAAERLPDLIATPAAVRFVSAEPLLGLMELGQPREDLPANVWLTWLDELDWVIAGGESGPGARPSHPEWFRQLRDDCAATETAFFFKQWGTHAWAERVEGDRSTLVSYRVGKKAAGRLLDGVEHNAMPVANA